MLLLHGNGSLGEEILSCFPEIAGVRWIAPDRPGYGFSQPLENGNEDPVTMGKWAAAFLDEIGIRHATVVAHSIAAGAALCLSGDMSRRVARLVLLAPFCRPTPHRWMLGLRLAVAPVVGGFIRRHVLPALLPLFRRHIVESMVAPNPVPPWLQHFPIEHAARPESITMVAAELRRFNDGMSSAAPRLKVKIPTVAVFGEADETAPPSWHKPWLRRHVANLTMISLEGVGHAVHHAAPATVLQVILGKPCPIHP